MSSSSPDLSPTKRALLALKQLQAKLDEQDYARHEPIAIVGMGCRFPGGIENPAAFWQLLQRRTDAITEVPIDRWPLQPDQVGCRQGGFLPHLFEFDAAFFRIAPREAISLDPQQRLLLEVSWEALEHGGIAADRLVGSNTGVFVGISSVDYWQRLLRRDAAQIDAYLTTGNTHSLAAGRISYVLGCMGPSLAIDTACSSSLVAVHSACQSLRQRECDLALAGGVNRILEPATSINFATARMLSPSDRCKTFDAKADGFVRSEGCGMVLLKRWRDAMRDGDPIWAVILGSAVNHDGRASGLTVPNGVAQQSLIRQALQQSQIRPDQVSYLETHGTGTALGDPIEVNALGEVFQARSIQQPLILGAVKTNIGHTEAAAGIAGLIKTVLALHHQEIPANLHFQTPNPQIEWQNLSIKVPTEPLPWLRDEIPRIAGISAFGFNGTNAHVILADRPPHLPENFQSELDPQSPPFWGDLGGQQVTYQSPPKLGDLGGQQVTLGDLGDQQSPPAPGNSAAQIFTLSAKSETALQQLIERYREYLNANPDADLTDLCYTAYQGRSHFNHRLVILVRSLPELQQKLAQLAQGTLPPETFKGRITQPLPTLTDRTATPAIQAQYYVQGGAIDWTMFYPPGRKIVLPTYPFQRQHYGVPGT